jgi:hypothetical protein
MDMNCLPKWVVIIFERNRLLKCTRKLFFDPKNHKRVDVLRLSASLKTSFVLLIKEKGRDEVIKKTVFRDALNV